MVNSMKKKIIQCMMTGLLLAILAGNRPDIAAAATEDIAKYPKENTSGDAGYIEDTIVAPAITEYFDTSDRMGKSESENTETEISKDSSDEANDRMQTQEKILGENTIPIRYDAREQGYITSVKSQQDNTCWAYSTVSMAEADMIAEQTPVEGTVLTADTADFSEDYLIYAFYHGKSDLLGNTTGDKTEPLGWYRGVGGNHIFTTFGLANQLGLAREEAADGIEWQDENPQVDDIPECVGLQNAYWINLKQNQSYVKRMILQHGSAGISLYYAAYYMQKEHMAYYNDTTANVNHAAVIVGWDDTYPASNFKTNPGADGAWLVKNSYGNSAGDGFFWISYQDKALTSNTAKAFVFDFESMDQASYVYQHDGTAGAYMESGAVDTGYRVESGGSIANVFMVPADVPTGYQSIYAVSVSLFAVNVNYRVQIYKNPTDAGNPASGTPMLAEPVAGKTTFAGYYTIPLSEEVIISAGDRFSIVMELTKENGQAISYFVDKSYTNGGWISFVNEVEAGESFAGENGSWTDLAQTGATARLKAFTHDYTMPIQELYVDKKELRLWNTQTGELSVTMIPQMMETSGLIWSSSDEAVAKVDRNGKVTATGAGSAVITVYHETNPQIKAECRTVVKQQAEAVILSGEKKTLTCIAGKHIKLKWKLLPEMAKLSSVRFQSSDEHIAVINKKGNLKAKNAGEAVIDVISKYDNQILASITVMVQASDRKDTEVDSEAADDSEEQSDTGVDDTIVIENVEQDQHIAVSAQAHTPTTGKNKEKIPKTGDTNEKEGWIFLLLLSGVLLVYTQSRRKRGAV